MEFDDLSNRVSGCAIEVHRHLGPGLLESACEQCLAHELSRNNIGLGRELSEVEPKRDNKAFDAEPPIASMLTRLIQRTESVAEGSIEYECEYRDAEYEYEGMPEQSNPPQWPVLSHLLISQSRRPR